MPVPRRSAVLGLTSALALTCPLLTAAPGASAAQPAASPTRASAATTQPPNVVILLTDDQPRGMLDVMPEVRALLQQQGVTYTHAVVPTPLCSPSRATLLTGRLPSRTGIYSNVAPDGGWQQFHDNGLEQSTLATWLNGAGYRTALVGKYINGFGSSSPAGYVPPGWDRFAGLLQRNGSYYGYGVRVKDRSGVHDVDYGGTAADYSTDVLASYATDFISATPQSTPLFLVYAPVAPHKPTVPAADDLGTVPWTRPSAPDYNERDISDKPTWLQPFEPLPWPSITKAIAREKETLRSVDRAVGRIIDSLGSRASDTLFVFMSDNGNLNGSHRLQGKVAPYARSSVVPLVLRWDGHLTHAVDGRPLSTVDVATTVLDAAGLQRRTDGHSLLAPSRPRGAVISEVATVTQSFTSPAYCAWRTRRWLYVEYSADQGRELYDYRNDPYELHNLAADPRYRPQMLSMRADAKHACSPVPPGFTW